MPSPTEEKPRGPSSSDQRAVEEVELALFLLDGSGSMCNPGEGATATYDGRKKAEHLLEITKETLARMHGGTKRDAFRVALITFAEEAIAAEVEVRGTKVSYFTPEAAIGALRPPCEITNGGKTSIVAALAKAREVLDTVAQDSGLPEKKSATIFLLTDGRETIRTAQEVRDELGKLRPHALAPTIAVVSLGTDADDELLLDVASEPTERQVRHLELAGVLGLISQEPRKLFLKGHSGGDMTKQQAEVIRNFLNVLSQTIAVKQGEKQ